MITTNEALSTSAPSVPIVPPVPSPRSAMLTTGTWDGARHWLASAGLCEQAKLFCQVMLGLELLALRKEHGISQGTRVDLSHDGISWDDIVQKETGLSHSSGYRMIEMAQAALPRLKKFPALKNFDPTAKPIAQLSNGEQTALAHAVHKCTDNLTQREFGESLGLWKKPPGNPNAKGGPHTGKPLTTAEQAAALRQQALETSGWMGQAISASNRNFFLLTEVNDLEVNAQIAVLEHALKLRHAWLAFPKAKRDPAALEKIMQSDPLKPL